MEYIQIPKEVFESLKIIDDYALTEREIAIINIHRKTLAKLIRHKALSMQFAIWSGSVQIDKVQLNLWIIQELEKVAKDIENINEVFEKQQTAEKQKEEQEKEE